MFQAINDGKIKAIWIMATNPAVSLPSNDMVIEALKKCPFVVVSDCIKQTDTTQLADVLLPAQGWSEKSGTVTNSERRMSRQRRLLPSPGMAKPDWWIVSKVAQKMGFLDAFDYLHEGEIFQEYVGLTTIDQDQSPRAFNLSGLVSMDEVQYAKMTPQQWPVAKYQFEATQNRFFADNQFFTPTKKAQFVAVRHCKQIVETNTDFPLELNTGRARDQWHTMTRTGLSASLAGIRQSHLYWFIRQPLSTTILLLTVWRKSLVAEGASLLALLSPIQSLKTKYLCRFTGATPIPMLVNHVSLLTQTLTLFLVSQNSNQHQ